MAVTGRCYCGNLRYESKAGPAMSGQCYCRECQYISGGAPNNFVALPIDGFSFTAGEPKSFSRGDLDHAVSREFCPDCGTGLTTRVPGWPVVIVKVGTLDDPAAFKPTMAIQTADKQPYHNIPEGLAQFDRYPPR